MKTKANSYDIIGEAVLKFWNHYYPCDVVVFFEQKHEYDDARYWFKEEVIAEHDGSGGIIFNWDFCEGQTDVRNIEIDTLESVLQYYRVNVITERLKEGESE